MDEARRVLERLERIERLRDGGAPASALLVEVRALLSEGERWLASERPGGLERATAALESCRAQLERDRLDSKQRGEVVARAAL
jgi:hypothetical protein